MTSPRSPRTVARASHDRRKGARRPLLIAVAALAVISSILPLAPAAFAAGNQGLQIDGVDTHGVLLGTPGALGAAQFTLELWFKRTGNGVVQSTGSGGNTDSIPLITKGRSEGDGSAIDTNYYFGIDQSSGELEADFEDMASGANHPVNGATNVSLNVWHHGAATFNGSQFCIYLDGVLDGTCTATTAVPRSDSIQRPAIGTSTNSTGVVAGSFAGQVDEARIWNVAHTQAQIQATMNSELTSGTGLIGRWGMNEGSGPTATGSVGGIDGTLTAGVTWVAGAPALDPVTPPSGNQALQFNGTNQYVTFGTALGLGAPQFTLETWFKRTGTGAAVSTGTGGVTAIPLITKGRHDADGSNLDMNYFLGIDSSTGTLVGDFEDLRATNNNNPVNGATVVSSGVWHHAAATFNGSQFCLYLDGVVDGSCLATTQTPQSASIEHAGLGTGMESTGVAEGFFAGAMDEARIWNVAHTQAQIQATMNSELTSGTGLIGRWGMNDGSGTAVGGSIGSINGTLPNGATWVAGAPALGGGPPPPPSGSGLQIDGVDTHGVLLGTPGALGAAQFTLELWFKRTGNGVVQSTGTGGNTDSIPLITKGRSENDGSNIDTNYYFGIDQSSGELEADFEDMATGANHPVNGATPVTQNVWHHGAATFNGSQFCIYLDGVLDGTCTATTAVPRSDSIQRPAIGTSTNSTGVVAGSFAGQVDEARIWNVAHTQAQIQATMNSELTSGTGLIGRWGMNEGSGPTATGSVGSIDGTLTAGVTWGPGAPLGPTGEAPAAPVVVSPANGATGVGQSPTLDVTVSDPDSSNLNVTFYGRQFAAPAGQDFTLMTIPDTQWYSENIPSTRNAIYTAQMNWIVSSKTALNTVFATHLGDITQNFDTVEAEWQRASANQAILDSNGVRNGVNTGNHDFANSGSSSVAHFFDQYFPPSRYQGFPWYGGYLGDPNDGIADGGNNRLNKDNYALFSAGGMDFVIIQIEHDMPAYATAWAQNVINAFPSRRVIISTHAFVNSSGQRGTSPVSRTDGQSAATVWTNLIVPNCQIFMVVNGHYHGQGRRTDNNSCGQPVFQLNSDYQDFANGGDGWLRYYTFKPSENKIYAFTYSPTLNSFDSPLSDDQFTLDWSMGGGGSSYQVIGTVNGVASGGHATIPWNNLDQGTQYEWYAAVSDGSQTTNGTSSTFTTEVPPPSPPVVDSVTINQATPRTNDTLTLNVQSHDVNNDPITYQYQWLKNGSPVGGNAATLNLATAGNGDKGDSISVTVTANDGSANSAPVTSAAVTVLNTAPTATVALSPSSPDATQTVTATATRADVDTDAVTLTYVWKVNGTVRKTTAATASLTDTLDLSSVGAANGDTLSIELTPNDGTTNGTMVSANVPINIPIVSAIPDSTTFQANDRVNAILRIGNTIYLGGEFTQLLGHNGEIVPRQYIAAVNATTGVPLAWDPGFDGFVDSLAASPDGSILYAGGAFRHVGTLVRTRLAAVDATTGAVLPWAPSAGARVRTIVTSDNTVYTGGLFTTVTGQGQTSQPRTRLAAFNASNGQLVSGWTPAANASPRDMVMTPDNRLVVVGDFTTISGAASSFLAPLDPTTGALLPWANRPSDATQGVAIGPNRLFAGVGTGAAGNQVVAFDLATGTQQWLRQGDGDVVDVAYMNGTVYAGGHFDNMAGAPRGRLAAFDAVSGTMRADWTPTVNTTVAIVTMLAAGNKLYIGGAFTLVSGVGQQRYASFSGAPAANTPPVVDSVVINQASPGTNAVLSATVTAHDADGNPLTYAYQWTRNGTDIAGATTATLDMSIPNRGDKGDLIRLRVTANDGVVNSPAVTSAPVTVANTVPTATVVLNDHSPGTNATITATATRSDVDGDTVSLTYLWTVNGTTRQTTTTTNLTDTFDLSVAGNGDPGDSIVVTVTPNDGTANGSGVSDSATVPTGGTPPIFTDEFANLNAWTSVTRVTIDNAIGSPAVPSARAVGSNQSAFAYHDLGTTTMTPCMSVNVNVASGTGADLFRLRTAANGGVIKAVVTAAGTLQLRSDFGGTTINSGVALGTGWHNVELCGTVGGATTWNLYRDGVQIVTNWVANTGTTPVGRIQIGDTAAKTFTFNFDHVRVDLVPGEGGGGGDTQGPTTPGTPTGSSP
ncbi:MAG: LamG-like jellyroll fold domain-containing protein, partial [Actinomycetota bacterium]